MEKPIRRKAQVSASHGGPNRAGLNETLSKNWCSSPLSWTQALVDCLVLVTDVFQYGTFESIQPEVAQWSQPWTYSSEKKNAFAALGFLFTVTSVLHCLPASSILSPMTITKAIHNLTYQIVLFYNNLVAICKIQDKTVQFLMLNIWGALEAVQARYALKSVMRRNYNRQTFWRVYTLAHLCVHGISWCYSGDLQINSAFRLSLP